MRKKDSSVRAVTPQPQHGKGVSVFVADCGCERSGSWDAGCVPASGPKALLSTRHHPG